MRLAFVGCGYVADFYAATLANHPALELVGAVDLVAERAQRFADFHRVAVFPTLDAVLGDPRIDLVVNLTPPAAHVAITRACLLANKHVYTEKPVAMTFADARELTELSERRGVLLAAAPCNLLSESSQTLWRAVRQNSAGPIRLVYAELDDGPMHKKNFRGWRSRSGAPWPYIHEFEAGCTMEHASYPLTLLTAMFGAVSSVTRFAACIMPNKCAEVPAERDGDDFSVSCLQFESGAVARLTCGIVAPRDRKIRLIGDDGVITLADAWNYGSKVFLRRERREPAGPTGAMAPAATKPPLPLRTFAGKVYRKMKRTAQRFHKPAENPDGVEIPLVRSANYEHRYPSGHDMDFARGLAEVAAAATERRPCRLSARHALHVTEVTIAIAGVDQPAPGGDASQGGAPSTIKIRTRFDPIEPMPWAC